MARQHLGNVGGVRAYLEVEEAPRDLSIVPTAAGFKWVLPMRLHCDGPSVGPQDSDDCRVLTGIGSATIAAIHASGKRLELGTALALRPTRCRLGGSTPLDLTLTGPKAALAALERHRDGGNPRFSMTFVGEFHLLRGDCTKSPSVLDASLDFTFSKGPWLAALSSVGVSHAVLIEIPLNTPCPPGWEEVWQAVQDARTAFDHGGPEGWANCAVRAREALDRLGNLKSDKWREVPETDRTLSQRVDAVRDALRKVTHLGAHGPTDAWSRADALFILSTLVALLSRETTS